MASTYESFLRSPNVALLAPDACLHYVTTTTSIKGADAILKHLKTHETEVQKKSEKLLSSTAGSNGSCVETETTFVFQRGGGSILPNMDVNMLADVTVVLPMVHIASLNASNKITQIRIYWDQGTVLKQADAIGKTGRNWPIRDGREQSQLIKSSVESLDAAPRAAPAQSSTGRMPDEYTKRLFDTSSNEPRSSVPTQVECRESARPQQRQWGELFPGEADSQRAPMRANKNHQQSRLFDTEPEVRQRSPQRRQVDPTKNDHFEWGNGEDVLPIRNDKAYAQAAHKQVSNWDLDDVSTPHKHAQKYNPEQERHIGYGNDPEHGPTPAKRNPMHPPRPDNVPHFEITDQQTPDHGKQPLSTLTNINATRRHEDYDPHFDIKDQSSPQQADENARAMPKPKVRSDMVSHFDLAQMSADTPAKARKIYKTAGNGMGGHSAQSTLWDVETEADEPLRYGGKGGVKKVYKTAGNGMGGRKGQAGLGWSIGDPDAE